MVHCNYYLLFLLAASLAFLGEPSSRSILVYNNVIRIDPSTGENSDECLSSQVPCRNLSWAFQPQHRRNSTQYVLSPGMHFLTDPTPPFQDHTFLAFTGAGSTVDCTQTEDTGLAFINVKDITFSDITFQNCAAVHNSTSKDYENGGTSLFKVALYFYSCESINMSHVGVSHSPNAMGVMVYDTNGTNTISHSVFSNNSVGTNDKVFPGGGGFYVEFTYCKPGVLSCTTPTSERNSGASYTFSFCNFSHNQADNMDTKEKSTYILPYKVDHQAFGRGGGLSLFIRGKASNITFIVENSRFEDNVAVWGGGLFVELHDDVHGSKITVSATEFTNNSCPFTIDGGTGGGAIRIAHYVYGNDDPLYLIARNEITVDSCTFMENSALNGAGVSISWALQKSDSSQTARISILRSFFQTNTAKLGAAVHISQFWKISEGLEATFLIEGCTFDNNTVDYYHKIRNFDSSSTPFQIGIGTVCVTSSNVMFRKNVTFTNNHGSALSVSGGKVNFDGCHVQFINGTANKGAGIVLLGASTIELGPGTDMLFENNVVKTQGGAIHATYISRENLETDANCFVRYVDPAIHPDDWNVTMRFINNTDHTALQNAIFATSILPCSVIGGSGIRSNKTGSALLCWKGWHYYNTSFDDVSSDCGPYIISDVGKIEFNNENDNTVKAIPGWDFAMPVSIKDDLNTDVSRHVVFTSYTNQTAANHTGHADPRKISFFWGKNATVRGLENVTTNMMVETSGDRIWYFDLAVKLQLCPPGFKINDGECQCASNYGDVMYCDNSAKEARLLANLWMGFFNGSYYVSICPPNYCKKQRVRYFPLPHSIEEMTERICEPHRTGKLCGECINGTGPAVNSPTYDCIPCTDINLAANIAKYIASIYLPLGFLFTILIFFDIRLTTGPANAFILYCQIIVTTFSIDANGGTPLGEFTDDYRRLSNSYTLPYGIFNLDFLENYIPNICFSTSFSTLSVLLLDYSVALSPLLMILLVLICLKIKECFCSGRQQTTAANLMQRRGRKINEALLPAFASFILLSYTKLSIISSYILTTVPLIDENGTEQMSPRVYFAGQYSRESSEYLPYYLLAILIYCTFLSITPLMLLDFPLRGLEWIIARFDLLKKMYPADKIHILLDTFQGCYRKDVRFFAGLYFLFRVAVNVSYIFFNKWIDQFVFQQVLCTVMVTLLALYRPYRRKFLNYVDILIFTDLALINCLSFYFFVFFKIYPELKPSLLIFIIQYILIVLPLVYMLTYILWRVTKRHHRNIKEKILKFSLAITRRFVPAKSQYRQLNTAAKNNVAATSRHSAATHGKRMGRDEVMFERAKEPNSYVTAGALSVTVVDVGDACEGEASVCQTSTMGKSDSGPKSQKSEGTSGVVVTYGSTGASNNESGRPSTDRSY